MIRVVPTTLAEANALVTRLHRHHKAAVGHRWSIGLEKDGTLIGAVIVGRPVARKTPQYSIAEVSRCVTDGTKNACSCLYAAACRAARAMGYSEIQTFILEDEPGTSLIAAGWKEDTERRLRGGNWNVPSRGNRRVDQPMGPKRRFYKLLAKAEGRKP